MTDMVRTTIYLQGETVDKIKAMAKDDEFSKCSKTEIIRILVNRGLESVRAERA